MRPLRITSITFSQVLTILGFTLLGILFALYLYHQARSFINGPMITLNALPVMQHERRITLTGETENIVAFYVNGKEIYTDEEGVFAQPIVLENGYTILTLTAKDRFGRHTSLTQEFVYVPVAM